MATTRTRIIRSTAVAGALAAVAVTVTLPAFAAGEDYVALGDSYAAGVGAGNYLNDGTDCSRSLGSYAGVLANSRGYALNLQACSGAVTADVPGQLAAVSSSTRRVTLSVGGNDIGFAPVVTECAKPSWWGNCNAAVDRARATTTDVLPGRLRTVYGQLKAKAPNAKVVVTGYPRMFNGRDCSIATFFSGDEMTRMNAAADLLNATIRREATAAGFQFVDVTQPFIGHAVCDNPEWIHNASMRLQDSFHPKADGHRAYATAIGSRLDSGYAYRSATTVRTGGTTSSDTRRGTPRIPDLQSREAKAAAQRAGVRESEVAELAEATKKLQQQRAHEMSRAERVALERAKDLAGRG
ncbi:SGNH/GDSL hydrolase family protein [Mariniluteicoccus flavus]